VRKLFEVIGMDLPDHAFRVNPLRLSEYP